VEQVVISSIAAGGEGVGRLPDGRAVFVHRTAPGERVSVEVFQERPRWARARLLRVLEPSPSRRDAPCPHYARRGGCKLEHLEYPAQLAIKGRIAADALRRIGGLDVDEPDVVASPLEHRYRNRVSFALLRAGAGRVFAGFHALHDPGRIVPVDGSCLLPEEPIARVWDRLRDAWGDDARRLPSGERLRLTLRSTESGAVSLLVEGGFSRGRPEELLERVEGLHAIWFRSGEGPAEHVAGVPGLPETWGDEAFEVGGTAFLQVNRSAARVLEDHVMERAGLVEGRTVVDAYCGIGLHSRRLAAAGASVTGIELDADAVRIARGWGSGSAEGSGGLPLYLEGRVEDVLGSVLPAELLILNPPRAGVAPGVIEAILEQPPRRILYVSCDPATLARDLARLATRFRLEHVRCFDLFPQTAHVETVVELVALTPEGS
jgi:23S rRNA (uracil1939-C5)-methyltransferase